MECNKDEAKRAMDIAERKVTEKDYDGAKKFANKAQNLYPPLDGVKQLMMMIDVYISGEKRIGGEADWYGILNVDPFADDETIRKQYRKLVLLLHPDKNKCKGAEGAFQLLSEAWSLVSDKGMRLSYNLRRQVKEVRRTSVIPPRQQNPNGFQNTREPVVSTARANGFQNAREPVVSTARANGFQNAREPVVSTARARARAKPAARMDRSRMDPPAFVPPVQQESSTFWTMCDRCKTQYEYLRVYLNQTLLCPNCRVGFTAAEKAPPPSVPKSGNLSSKQQRRSSKPQAPNKRSYTTSFGREPAPSVNHSFQWDSSRMAGSNSQNAPNQAANVVQQAQDTVKRGFGESQERDAARRFTDSDLKNFKKPRMDDSHMFAGKWSDQIGVTMGSRFSTPSNPANGNTEMPNTIGSRHPHIQGMLLPCDITKALVNKAHADIVKRLPKMISEMEEDVKAVEREKKSLKATSKMCNKANAAERGGSAEEILHDSDPEDNEVKAIVVPDSDFHNFDLDRTENSFEDDQIWAAYDDDDGMPRFYARIQKVISLNPFKLRISWLNTKTCSEFSPIDWVGSGFAKSCGDFRIGKYELTDALNAFSHKVDFTKGARGILHILPRKGQVWALYRNWSPEWDKNTPDEVKHKYDMVEVLDDYTEDKPSVTVTLLVKAEGFKAVFRRSTDQNDVRKIPKEEMFRFSHQVPHHILTGNEADNAPEGCLELDPAATPCELLSENAEAKGSSKMDDEKSEERSSIPMDDEKSEERSSIPMEEVGMNLD